MKVSKAIPAALLAATAIAGSTGAFASTSPDSAPSDLFIAIWNPSTSTSIVQDLGTGYAALSSGSTFESSAGYTTSWTIDNGNLTSDLGSGTWQYQVFAADDSTPYNFYSNSAYLTLTAGDTIPSPILNNQLVTNGITSIANYINNFLPSGTTLYKGSASGPTVGGIESYWASSPNGDGINDAFTMNSLTDIGGGATTSALNLIYYVGGGTAEEDSPDGRGVHHAVGNSAYRGVFTFSGDTLTYTLEAATASTVPLPPAGWLLISGLLALLAVGRRRDAQAL